MFVILRGIRRRQGPSRASRTDPSRDKKPEKELTALDIRVTMATTNRRFWLSLGNLGTIISVRANRQPMAGRSAECKTGQYSDGK